MKAAIALAALLAACGPPAYAAVYPSQKPNTLNCDPALKTINPPEVGFDRIDWHQYQQWRKGLNRAQSIRVDRARHALQQVARLPGGAITAMLKNAIAVCLAEDLAHHGVPGLYVDPVGAAELSYGIYVCSGSLACGGWRPEEGAI